MRFIHKKVLDKNDCKKLLDIHKKWAEYGHKDKFEIDIRNIPDKNERNFCIERVRDVLDLIFDDWKLYYKDIEDMEIDLAMLSGYNHGLEKHQDRPYRKWSCSVILNDNYTLDIIDSNVKMNTLKKYDSKFRKI